MFLLFFLGLVLVETTPAMAKSPRTIQCDGLVSSVTMRDIATDSEETWELHARFADYHLHTIDPQFTMSVHGLRYSGQLPPSTSETEEYLTIFFSPEVLRGPSSSSLFPATLLFSRHFQFREGTPITTETDKLRCYDSRPWRD